MSPEYPSDDLLQFWWRCWRKTPYHDHAAAEAVVASHSYGTSEVYPCSYGSHLHVGQRKTTAKGQRGRTKPGDLRRQWRRAENLRGRPGPPRPTVADLADRLAELSENVRIEL